MDTTHASVSRPSKWVILRAWNDQEHILCSFDIVKDKLGGPRTTFPHDVTVVAGTQAASAESNYIAVMRFSNLTQVQ
jgi:hypothetical protein